MTPEPVNVAEALASFDAVYSPRILASVNDYHVRIAHTLGEHVWHVHEETDEFFLVLRGRFDVALRDADGERTVQHHRPPTVIPGSGAPCAQRDGGAVRRSSRSASSSC